MDNADENYAEMLGLMRDQGSRDNPTTLFIGVVKKINPIEIEIDDLVLKSKDKDLLFADHLLAGYKFPLKTSYVSAVNFGSETVSKTNPAVRSEGLKKGDLVAVMKLNDNDTYVVLERVRSE